MVSLDSTAAADLTHTKAPNEAAFQLSWLKEGPRTHEQRLQGLRDGVEAAGGGQGGGPGVGGGRGGIQLGPQPRAALAVVEWQVVRPLRGHLWGGRGRQRGGGCGSKFSRRRRTCKCKLRRERFLLLERLKKCRVCLDAVFLAVEETKYGTTGHRCGQGIS